MLCGEGIPEHACGSERRCPASRVEDVARVCDECHADCDYLRACPGCLDPTLYCVACREEHQCARDLEDVVVV
jgi:hypothetical protein